MNNKELIKKLREKTNISLGICKKAADKCSGDIDKALILLQEWGHLKASERSSRAVGQGKVYSYIHAGDKLGVMVEVNCESDFSANSDPFEEFCEDVAMQVAATSPQYVSRDCVDDLTARIQKAIYIEHLKNMKKTPKEDVWQKILDGKMNSWYSEICLMEQESVRYPKKSVEDLRCELVAQIGENVVVKRFVRWEVGGE